jgi:tripartite-type tricarboxylate transporter receptor subunit TctC
MQIQRRQFLHLATGAAVFSGVSSIVNAQAYPTRPVRIIVPFAAGGGTDVLARLIGQWLTERLGQPFIVENRPGGGSNIGTEAVVRAAPDGYTLLMITPSNTTNATLYDKLNFNFIRDIAPVAGVIRAPFVPAVNLSIPVRTVPEFITYAKANPGKVNMASAGSGTVTHMTGELFKMMTAVDLQHVPYRGGGPALLDLIAGQVQVYFAGMTETIEYIRGGKVRPLAVTSTTRAEAFPDLPAVAEFVPGYESNLWFGVGAPSKTPPDIIDHRQAQPRDQRLPCRSQDKGAAHRTRWHRFSRFACRLRQVHGRRNREVGQGHPDSQYQAGVTAANIKGE